MATNQNTSGDAVNSINGERRVRNGVQGAVLNSINGEERVRNGVSRRSDEQYLWRGESKKWSIKEKC